MFLEATSKKYWQWESIQELLLFQFKKQWIPEMYGEKANRQLPHSLVWFPAKN